MINDIRIVEEYGMILEKEIIVYGCGSSGRNFVDFMRMLGCRIKCFCDSDIEKRGNIVYGIEVCHKSDLHRLANGNTIIIVASVYYKEIINEIISFVPKEIIFTKFSFCLSVYLHYHEMNFKNLAAVNEYMENWRKTELDNMENYLKKVSVRDYQDVSQNAVLIYQSGKVGSSSLWRTLKNYGIKCAHIHTLAEYSSNADYLGWCRYIRETFQGKIIIPVREPIARDISEYFHALGHCLAAEIETYGFHDLYDGFYQVYYDSLINETDYIEKYSYPRINYAKYGWQFDFFEKELKKYFGIDVFGYPFDSERGYSIIEQDGKEIFIVQLERMHELEKEIGCFLNIPDFEIQSFNRADEKVYRYLYTSFKDNLSLKEEYINFYYKNNKAVDHFYSEEQRQEFYEKWIMRV